MGQNSFRYISLGRIVNLLICSKIFHLGYVLLMTEWENNSNVAVQDPDELGDEVKVEAEVDHGQNQGA